MVAILQQPPTLVPQLAIGNQKSAMTRGWIQTTYRHYKGKKLGPYYVRRWKEGKRIFKEYIKFEDLERIRAECDAYRRQKEQGRMHGRWVTNVAGNLNYAAPYFSALDPENESIIYNALIERLPNAAIVSVAHRKTLEAFHDHTLFIEHAVEREAA